MKNLVQEPCDLFAPWKECSNGCCGSAHAGYSKADQPVVRCVNGMQMIAQALTDDNNCDVPEVGARKNPPTWRVQTLSEWQAGKQDALLNCAGAALPDGTQVPTCAEMTAAITDAIAAAGGDGVVTGGTVTGSTLTLSRSVGADITIPNLPTYALQDCNGNALANGDSVASCAEFTAAINAANTAIGTKQDQLRDTANIDLVANQRVVSQDNLSTEDFSVDPTTGRVTVNTEELCITTQAATDPCGELKQLFVQTNPTTGCSTLLVPDGTTNLRVAGYATDNPAAAATAAGAMLPATPNDTATYYTIGQLRSDYTNNVVDQTKLDPNQVSCQSVVFNCDGVYEFEIQANPILDWAQQGEGAFIIYIDGVPMEDTPGVLRIFPRFTSVSGTYTESLEYPITAGTHTICTYLIGGNAATSPAAQVLFNTLQPRVVINKKITTL